MAGGAGLDAEAGTREAARGREARGQKGPNRVADYDLPENNRYSEDDEWVRAAEDGRLLVGITDYAQQQLGDIVFVEVPEVGTHFEAGVPFGVIESVKAVSELYCPLAGEVVAVNEALEDAPESVNESCYDDGWILALAARDADDIDGLMDAEGYRKYIAEREE